MTYLAIETSDPRGSLALFDASGCLEECVFPDDLVHAREFAVRLQALLDCRGLGVNDLVGVAVSIGPGSYTGCRVGVTVAKSLAFALGIPVLTLSSLEVLAATATVGEVTPGRVFEGLVAPILDGRRGFFYGAVFEVRNGSAPVRRAIDQVAQGRELAGSLVDSARGQTVHVVGEGADAFLAAVGGTAGSLAGFVRGASTRDSPRASILAALAAAAMGQAVSDPETLHALAPSYLRPSEPEIVYARRQSERRRRADGTS